MQMYTLHINNIVLYCLTQLNFTPPSAVYTFQCHTLAVNTTKHNGIQEKSFTMKKTRPPRHSKSQYSTQQVITQQRQVICSTACTARWRDSGL